MNSNVHTSATSGLDSTKRDVVGAVPYGDRQNFTLPRRGVQSEITKRADMKSAPTGNCEFFATPFPILTHSFASAAMPH